MVKNLRKIKQTGEVIVPPLRTRADRWRLVMLLGLVLAVILSEGLVITGNPVAGFILGPAFTVFWCLLFNRFIRPMYEAETREHTRDITRLKRD